MKPFQKACDKWQVQLQAQTKAVEVPVNLVHEQPVEVEQVQTIDVITQVGESNLKRKRSVESCDKKREKSLKRK